MISISAFKWVPRFARGQVRDLRARWALEEAGLDYEVRLIDREDQASAEYRALQPFGQVPALEEGDLVLFESGAIVLHIAGRTATLFPSDPAARARVVQWAFAALNTIEPPLMMLAEVDFFMDDEAAKAQRRPGVVKRVTQRLGELQAALGEREHLVGAFSAADILMATVLRIQDHAALIDTFPALVAYKERCEARPAFQRALRAQLADFAPTPPE